MERLTRRVEEDGVKAIYINEKSGEDFECFLENEYGYKTVDKLATYEDIIDDPEKLKLIDGWYSDLCKENGQLKRELAEYKKLEEEGLLLKLSVSEGSIVYLIDYTFECKHNYECPLSYDKHKCEEDARCQHEYKVYRIREAFFNICMKDNIGKNVFLTRKEAEQALERMKEVQDVN